MGKQSSSGFSLQGGLSREVKVTNENGLHLRPAALLVAEASKWQSEVQLRRVARVGGTLEEIAVSAKSIISVVSLESPYGTTITIDAAGPDAAEALTALVELFESGALDYVDK